MHAFATSDLNTLSELPAPLAVVCHDAGAANILFAWIAAAGISDTCLPVMLGPAARLWAERFPNGPDVMQLEAAMAEASFLLSGTGWASDLEHQARSLARRTGMASAAVIDHWVNYAERFSFEGETVLPDQILVADEYALAEARRAVPGLPVRVLPNLYLAEQIAGIAPLPEQGGDVLYLLEPARNDGGRGQPGEFQALDFFFSRYNKLGISPETRIRLRPHPSDPPGKYDDWIARHSDLRLSLDTSQSLSAAIGPARWVLGCESFALVIALEASRSAICTLPPWAPHCRLPHSGLIHLKELDA